MFETAFRRAALFHLLGHFIDTLGCEDELQFHAAWTDFHSFVFMVSGF